jgi:hypothetical protein
MPEIRWRMSRKVLIALMDWLSTPSTHASTVRHIRHVENTEVGFDFSALCRKKVTAAFDAGRLSSDGGVLLLAQIERQLRLAERLAKCIEDPRDPNAAQHSIAEMIRFRALLIAAGYADATRFIITNLAGSPEYLYQTVYCARGQAENLIKAHKLHLASDRTSCSKATANQFRLLIHTAAYWLLHSLRGLRVAHRLSLSSHLEAARRARSYPSAVIRGAVPRPSPSPATRKPS